MRFDLHVHTDISPCSNLSIDEILAHAKSLGLDGVCLTDHDVMDARRQVTEGIQADGLCVVIGMEYATSDGDFLLFGPYEDLRAGLPAEAVLGLVAETGGAAVAAHPFRPGRGVSERLMASGLCRIMEAVNGRNRPEDNRQTDMWRRAYAPVSAGGSDAHSLPELGRIATNFDTPVKSRADLIAALNQGLCRPEVLRAENVWRPRPGVFCRLASSL